MASQRTLDKFMFVDRDTVSHLEIMREEDSKDNMGGRPSTSVTHTVRASRVNKGDSMALSQVGDKRKREEEEDPASFSTLSFNIDDETLRKRRSKRLKTVHIDNADTSVNAIREIMEDPRHAETLSHASIASSELVSMVGELSETISAAHPSSMPNNAILGDDCSIEEEVTKSESAGEDSALSLSEVCEEGSKSNIQRKEPAPKKKAKKNRRGNAMGSEKVIKLVKEEKISEYTSHGAGKLMERARILAATTDCDILLMVTPNPKVKDKSRSKLVNIFTHGNIPMQVRRFCESLNYRLGKATTDTPRWTAKCHTARGRDKYIKRDEREPMAPYSVIQFTRKGKKGIVRVDYSGLRTTNQLHPRDVEMMVVHFNNMIDSLLQRANDVGVLVTREQVIEMYRRILGDNCMEFAPGMYMKNSMMVPLSRSVVEDLFENHRDEMGDIILHDLLTPPDDPTLIESTAEDIINRANITPEIADVFADTTMKFFALRDGDDNTDDSAGGTASDCGGGENADSYSTDIWRSANPWNQQFLNLYNRDDDDDDDDGDRNMDDEDKPDKNPEIPQPASSTKAGELKGGGKKNEAIFLPSVTHVDPENLDMRAMCEKDDRGGVTIRASDGRSIFIPSTKHLCVDDDLPLIGDGTIPADIYDPETGEIDLDQLQPLSTEKMRKALDESKQVNIHRGIMDEVMHSFENTIGTIDTAIKTGTQIRDEVAELLTPVVLHEHTIMHSESA